MAKLHQIRFRMVLRPRPRWESLQRSPRLPSWISGELLLRGRKGGKGGCPSPFAGTPPVGCSWGLGWPLCGLEGERREGKGVPLPKGWSRSATDFVITTVSISLSSRRTVCIWTAYTIVVMSELACCHSYVVRQKMIINVNQRWWRALTFC